MTHLNHSPFELNWHHQASDGLMAHSIRIFPTLTGKGLEDIDSLKLRTLCHLLLDYLPEEGLSEVKNSLIEAIEFYRDSEQLPASCPLNNSFEVTVNEGYERPIFQIMED